MLPGAISNTSLYFSFNIMQCYLRLSFCLTITRGKPSPQPFAITNKAQYLLSLRARVILSQRYAMPSVIYLTNSRHLFTMT